MEQWRSGRDGRSSSRGGGLSGEGGENGAGVTVGGVVVGPGGVGDGGVPVPGSRVGTWGRVAISLPGFPWTVCQVVPLLSVLNLSLFPELIWKEVSLRVHRSHVHPSVGCSDSCPFTSSLVSLCGECG